MRNILGKIIEKIESLTKKQKVVWGISGSLSFLILCVVICLLCYPMGSKQTTQSKKGDDKIVIEMKESETDEEVSEEQKKISFTGTSIEKDLKIKIVDESGVLVAGVNFIITLTAEKDELGQTYTDDDMDGIIHIIDMVAGNYTVRLHEVDGFVIGENSISMIVKDKIEYKKVDVKNEIKKESEVNVKKEDALTQKPQQGNQEETIKDTVKYLESSKQEVVITKENVDYSNFPSADVSENKISKPVVDGTTVSLSETATMYSQGGEKSRTCLITAEIVGQEEVIHQLLWKVESQGVFTLSQQSETTVLLTAKKIGTAELFLTVVYEDGATRSLQEKNIRVTVTVLALSDDKTQIKDKEGNPVYLDKENKQPAMIKDYSSDIEYYVTKYTGWQTIDEKTYYYNENHKVVTGTQIIDGVRYRFDEDGSLIPEQRGVDVSKWNGTIDWQAVAKAGIDFAVIRVGYRGYSAGTLVEDSYFKKNIDGATKAGVKVGIYFYSQAITEAEAVEEASMAVSLVSGYKLQLPIYFDTEYVSGGRANSLTVVQRTVIAKAFCETVKNAGYRAGIYSNYFWLRDNLNMSELNQYYVWVAHYNDKCGYPGKYDMWQYTEKGKVSGIKGNVDLNISYVNY